MYTVGTFTRNAFLLFLLWVLLSGRMEPLFLILGFVTAVGISALHARHPEPPNPTIPFFRFMVFLPWLFYRILLSNFHTVFLILHPGLPINPRLIPYQTHLRNPAAVTLLANSITLTPGTVTAEVNSPNLVVHALDEDSAKDLLTDRLEKKIFWVFGREGTQ